MHLISSSITSLKMFEHEALVSVFQATAFGEV